MANSIAVDRSPDYRIAGIAGLQNRTKAVAPRPRTGTAYSVAYLRGSCQAVAAGYFDLDRGHGSWYGPECEIMCRCIHATTLGAAACWQNQGGNGRVESPPGSAAIVHIGALHSLWRCAALALRYVHATPLPLRLCYLCIYPQDSPDRSGPNGSRQAQARRAGQARGGINHSCPRFAVVSCSSRSPRVPPCFRQN